jgi:hypothetical protein
MNRKEWLVAAILAFIIILVWVIFDIIHERQKVEIPTNIQQDIEPISPDFDTKVLESIR